MKYIIGTTGDSDELRAFVFDEKLQHSHVAAQKGIRAVRAGFYTVDGDEVFAGGESYSLDLRSDAYQDEPLIKIALQQQNQKEQR